RALCGYAVGVFALAVAAVAAVRRVVETGRPLALDSFLYPHDILGESRYFDIRAVPLGDELSYTWRDVTARQQNADDLAQRARTDELTKLLNRREVFDRLRDLHGKTPRTGHGLAVLFVDFDKFKSINDTHGHAAGDEVLRVTADRIRSCLRHDDDLGARVGGDEMMVVLHGVHGLPDAAAVAEKLRALAAQPVRYNGTTIPATVSIGVALAHRGENPEALVARADEAMYRAKQHGRNQVVTINGRTEHIQTGQTALATDERR
ncbi:MAG: GGDEF domain-containing protein, partial [Chthoniobacterales bacterium]